MEARPCHIYERNMHVKASAKRVQDLGKGDIIGGGDLCMYVYVHCSTKIVEQPHTHVLGGGILLKNSEDLFFLNHSFRSYDTRG